MTIAELNRQSREGFVAAIGWVFEATPWVAARAWERRPFGSLDHLHSTLASIVAAAGRPEQIALLKAHPDLGARQPMSTVSAHEQTGAGLSDLGAGELDRLTALNAAYTEKFGFPFIYAVKGATKQDILDALNRRLASSREDEITEALRQVCRIVRFRLEEVIS